MVQNLNQNSQNLRNKMITDKHKKFAREMIVLARKHGMDNLRLTFQQSHMWNAGLEKPVYNHVEMVWSIGRHGSKDVIHLSAKEDISIPEEEPLSEEELQKQLEDRCK